MTVDRARTMEKPRRAKSDGQRSDTPTGAQLRAGASCFKAHVAGLPLGHAHPTMRVMSRIGAGDLTTIPFTDLTSVGIEPTSECNLRCVYCVLSTPAAQHVFDTAPAERLHAIAEALAANHPQGVWLNGYGELTIHQEWTSLARRLTDAGLRVNVVSNLARLLSWEEARTLARFSQVNVSIDSAEPQVLRAVRKSADLRSIVTNIVQVRAAALLDGIPAPRFELVAVLTQATLPSLERLVGLAATLGMPTVHLTDVYRHTPEDTAAVGDGTLLPGMSEAIDRTTTAGARLGIEVRSEYLRANRRELLPGAPGAFTRRCTEAWSYVMFRANGDVAPCCMPTKRTSRAPEPVDLDAALNAPQTVALRRDLLEGTLDPLCRECTRWPIVPVAELRAEVERLVGVSRERAWIAKLPPRHRELSIRALGRNSCRAQGREVWITAITAGDGSSIPLSELALDKSWTVREGVPLSTGALGVAQWAGLVHGELTVHFVSHPWSGMVEVACDGVSQVIDLYAESGGTKAVRVG